MAGDSYVLGVGDERNSFLGMHQPNLGSDNLTSVVPGSLRDMYADRKGEEGEQEEEEEEEE